MPDVSACVDLFCPNCDNCARYLMKWSQRQAVSEFPRDREPICSGFIAISYAPFPTVSHYEAGQRARRIASAESATDD